MYKKIKTLGRGTFGMVYKAENREKSGDFVAVKRYINISKKDIPYQILREINVIKLLRHPNIIGIRDVNNVGQCIELVLEYGGESLRSYYTKTPYSQRIREIKSITYQIMAGILYMHKLGVIHRDLKPDNILINSEAGVPTIKICDFGLAKKLPPFKNDFNSYQVCTLCYRPPELFTTDNQNYNIAVDVWSLGCVLYEFVIKKPVFNGSTETVVLKSILSKIPIIQDDLDKTNLNHWKLEVCNTEKFYKLPPLYDIAIKDHKDVSDLDSFKDLVQSMLILDPAKRTTLEKAFKHIYLDEIKQKQLPLPTNATLEANRVRYYQDFYVRPKLPKQIPEDLRTVYVEYIIGWIDHYSLNEQAILIAINIFDQFICVKRTGLKASAWEDLIKNLDIISACSLMLASKYIDLTPLNIKNLRSKHSESQLIAWERIIVQTVNYDLNQPTLLNFYKELVEDKTVTNDTQKEIPAKHWEIIKKMICDYNSLKDRGIQEIKEILLNKIRNT